MSHLYILLPSTWTIKIEHHLFPGLNHCHLPLIAPVVRKTCQEFDVNYNCYFSWTDLMQSTIRWLKKLSKECSV